MDHKNHLILGVLSSIIFIVILYFWLGFFTDITIYLFLQILLLLFISPLFADLDHRHGKLREWGTVFGLFSSLFGVIFDKSNITKFGVFIASFAYLLCYTTKHRGFTHTIWFTFVYGFLVYYITKNIQLSILGIFSYYTHLICDKLWYKLY